MDNDKIAAVAAYAIVLLFISIAILLAGFGINELRYFVYGRMTTAKIESAVREFDRFSNDELTGSTPIYRNRITYWFDAGGSRNYGETTVSDDEFAVRRQSISVQYIGNSPQRHRVLTPSFQIFRHCYFAMLAWGCVWSGYRGLQKWKSVSSATAPALAD